MASGYQTGSTTSHAHSEAVRSWGNTPRSYGQNVRRKIRRTPYDGHEMKVLGELLISPFNNPIAKGMFAGDALRGHSSPDDKGEADFPDPHVDYYLCANTGNTPIAWYSGHQNLPSSMGLADESFAARL